MNKKVAWSKRAKASLDYYCDRIALESPPSAKKVRKKIVTIAKSLSKNPNLYQVDEHYPDNPGNIRRFFQWSYRVVYQVREESVVILNVYHTSQHPETK
ncbi:type II toxin-antitoxin system RelE/ParE family toxin [Fulvivirga sp. M361]|uniref:type II toxin-antitoxin system RelE/ParE family toxin n=1 Tax=Fulvivirga sp. M361 TaxID=2594266 RepID=UPI00117AA1B9|nr:type II toxin-antitoxin system RelE/ParE family toxin [Fulvivirga sp. M361]TRX45806.1 type II toxin-antitoxin system RelE/ParE family toxin [Fulvivirga sp. M361]